MTEKEEEISIGELSDTSGNSTGAEEIAMARSPPSRGALERESGKLRSKFKILRQALHEEQLAEIEQQIEQIKTDADPAVTVELRKLKERRVERTMSAHSRKRVKVEAIINEYKSRVQSIQDEKTV